MTKTTGIPFTVSSNGESTPSEFESSQKQFGRKTELKSYNTLQTSGIKSKRTYQIDVKGTLSPAKKKKIIVSTPKAEIFPISSIKSRRTRQSRNLKKKQSNFIGESREFVTFKKNPEYRKNYYVQSSDFSKQCHISFNQSSRDFNKFYTRSSCDRKSNNTNKSIQSVTIYKGPMAQKYKVNHQHEFSAPKRSYKGKITSFVNSENQENKNGFHQRESKPIRHSMGMKDYERFIDPNQAPEKELFKASSVLPGTSNLIISQDIPKSIRYSSQTYASPFSSSTRSSIKRANMFENINNRISIGLGKMNT